MKLADTRMVMLSKAAQRPDRCIEVPPNVSASVAEKLATKMVGAGLIKEIKTTGALPVWRSVGDQNYSLRVTDKGLQAVGIAPVPESVSSPSTPTKLESPNTRRKKSERPVTQRPNGSKKVSRAESRGGKQQKSKHASKERAQRLDTKLAEIIRLLSRKNGTTINDMVTATGWQAHSVRGANSGTIKKKLGLKIVSEKQNGARRYRVAGSRA